MEKGLLYQKVQQAVISGKLPEAFRLLRTQELDPATARQVDLIEAEYNALRQQEIKGTLAASEVQLRKNQINDRLLSLLQAGSPTGSTDAGRQQLWLILPLILIVAAGLFWWFSASASFPCPSFPSDKQQRVLILPFANVGDKKAKPHILLRDRINQLSTKNNLLSYAKCSAPLEDMSMELAPEMAADCDVQLLVWGSYSSRADSIHLILHYHFSEKPEAAQLGELISLRDVTELQSGKMLKDFEDAVFSLCGLIALREGDLPLTEKWLQKVSKKEKVDQLVLRALPEKSIE